MANPSKRKGDELEWRAVPGWPDYFVSEDGQLRRALRGHTDKYGYKRYSIRGHTIEAHSLVCRAFHGPKPSQSHLVAHWDDNPKNNHYTNLRWATPQENSDDAIRNGRIPRGENNHKAKLTEQEVLAIRAEYTGAYGQIKRLAAKYGIAYKNMRLICRGEVWRHVGA